MFPVKMNPMKTNQMKSNPLTHNNSVRTNFFQVMFILCAVGIVFGYAQHAIAQENSNAGNALVLEAYELTKTADTHKEYQAVLEKIEQGLQAGVDEKTGAYGKNLQAWAYNRLGQVFLDENHNEQAIEQFNRALELDNKQWRAFQNRGLCYASQRNFEKAISDLNQAIALNSNAVKAYSYLGDVYYAQGNFPEAITNYSQVLRLDSRNSDVYNQRGHAYYMTGRYQSALSDFNQAIRLNPNDVDALIYRGDLYNDSAYYERAAADYRRAITIDDKSDRAYVSAAWMMATCPDERFRSADRAISAAEKAIELIGDEPNPFKFRYLEALAAAQANAEKFEDAIKLQSEAIAAAPQSEHETMEARKKLYSENQPYRNPRRVRTSTSPRR